MTSTPRRVTGIITITSKRTGYLRPDPNQGLEDDVFINTSNLLNALHGDTVEVELIPASRPETGLEGKIVRLIGRKKTKFVGAVKRMSDGFLITPDEGKIHVRFFVPFEPNLSVEEGDKVAVELVSLENGSDQALAKIERIFGKSGNNDVEMKAILYTQGFEQGYPADVLDEANRIPRTISAEEIAKRRDMRGVTTFTIDPLDAKDFDDAISFQKNNDGTYEIGVHIADVSHYVKEDTALDREALRRATSVYMVDRVIPMLPEILSNELCSLREKEDKLTFSAIFTLNQEGEILSEWFGKTVIHSDKRFVYEDAQEILNKKEGLFAEELLKLNELAYKLRKMRFDEGAVAFESEEVRFHLDETGKPLGVYKKVRTDIHLLVEDFMLLANKRVARFVAEERKGKHFVYRNHDLPNIDKIANLASFVQQFGYSVKIEKNVVQAKDLNDLLKRAEGSPEAALIQSGVLRSMSKANYSTGNIGHFGLAFEHYTHFTSPIRRYPDVMVHRLLDAYLNDTPATQSREKYEEMCLHSSRREYEAMEAERASIKLKQAEFLKEKIGSTYEGIISGVTKWGMYVETTDEKFDGMVRIGSIGNDFFDYDEKAYSIVGRRSGKRFRLGDKVKVRVREVDTEKRQVDFALA